MIRSVSPALTLRVKQWRRGHGWASPGDHGWMDSGGGALSTTTCNDQMNAAGTKHTKPWRLSSAHTHTVSRYPLGALRSCDGGATLTHEHAQSGPPEPIRTQNTSVDSGNDMEQDGWQTMSRRMEPGSVTPRWPLVGTVLNCVHMTNPGTSRVKGAGLQGQVFPCGLVCRACRSRTWMHWTGYRNQPHVDWFEKLCQFLFCPPSVSRTWN